MIRDYLAGAGFALLDREWCGVRDQYRFRCGNKHVSSQTGASLMRLVRGERGPLVCRRCWIDHTLVRLHDIARQVGAQCLSKRYRVRTAPYRFVCAVGHKFATTGAFVLEGQSNFECPNSTLLVRPFSAARWGQPKRRFSTENRPLNGQPASPMPRWRPRCLNWLGASFRLWASVRVRRELLAVSRLVDDTDAEVAAGAPLCLLSKKKNYAQTTRGPLLR
jgi:hypothetical protein